MCCNYSDKFSGLCSFPPCLVPGDNSLQGALKQWEETSCLSPLNPKPASILDKYVVLFPVEVFDLFPPSPTPPKKRFIHLLESKIMGG